uniref:acylphosphatase n=1 Tax=Romanomermis culicivorax TaxID=13658 RepID=A0A915J9I2_ROMCU
MINVKCLHLSILFFAVAGLSILFLLINLRKIPIIGGMMASSSNSENNQLIKSVDFEVFGRVQGVFFRKYTKLAAERLKLVGFCRNTESDTVEGRVQGISTNIDEISKLENDENYNFY